MKKSLDQRRQEFTAATQRERVAFLDDLSKVHSRKEAVDLVRRAVPEGAPGRNFYANLAFFLTNFTAPESATADELNEYLRLTEYLVAERILSQEKKLATVASLTEALQKVSPNSD